MLKKKKRRRVGYGPMGTPGAGPGKLHASAAARGPGRLDKAMRSLAKKGAATPTATKQPTPRDLARWANDGGDVGAASQPRPSAKPTREETRIMGKQSRPGTHTAKTVAKESAAFGRSAPDAMDQLYARTAAKAARKKEAGLEGNRTGKASATGRRAQGLRDSKRS